MPDGSSPDSRVSSETAGLPNFLLFAWNMHRVLNEKPIPPENLPPFPENPSVVDLARYAQVDWEQLQKDAKNRWQGEPITWFSMYRLAGAMMASANQREGVDCNLTIIKNWKVVDGRRRALVLRTLGPGLVEALGLSSYFEVEAVESKPEQG